MKEFLRVLSYVKTQKTAVIVSIVFALLIAVLFSLNIAAVLPVMKVLLSEEEGVHGWVYREIIEHRTGLQLKMTKKVFGEGEPSGSGDFHIWDVQQGSPAEKSEFIFYVNDQLVMGASNPLELNAAMSELARMTAPSVSLRIRRSNGLEETLTLRPKPEPFYAGIAYWGLTFLPQEQGKDFVRRALVNLIIFVLVLSLLRCLLRFGQEYLVRRIAFRTLMLMRLDTFRSAVHLPLSFYSQQGVSDTLSRFIQDSNQVNRGIVILLGKGIREPLKIIVLLATAFVIDATMTLIVVLGAPLGFWVLSIVGKKMKKATRRTLENWSKVLGRLKESLQGIRVVKAYHREDYEQAYFKQVSLKLLKQQNRMAKVAAGSGPILESLGVIGGCIGMAVAVNWITGDQIKMSVPKFSAIVLLLGAIAAIGRSLGSIVARFNAAAAAAERVFDLIDRTYETDPPNAITLEPLSESLEIRDVSFTYPNSPQPTLSNINLKIKAGQTIAVVGPNGSGKSTLLSLIPKFFDPDQGQLLIDGKDIATASLSSLRQQIGIVTQQTIVFNETIYYNIAYGDPEADRDQVIAASQQAFAHEFIEQTELGYETIIGEQGATLSGGQLQRLAIARAILRDPAILILDEATSQIDSDSEAQIQKALAEFTRHRTSFVIAHRLSTIVDADQILVLDQGQLIAQGTHANLLKDCELYQRLYEMQFCSS